MKRYSRLIDGMWVHAPQYSALEIYERPIREKQLDVPMRQLMPHTIFRNRRNPHYQRLRLLKRILWGLVETLALEMIDDGNVFCFPGGGYNLRLGICNISQYSRAFRPQFATDNNLTQSLRVKRDHYFSGYRWECTLGKALFKRLKLKWLAGHTFRRLDEL